MFYKIVLNKQKKSNFGQKKMKRVIILLFSIFIVGTSIYSQNFIKKEPVCHNEFIFPIYLKDKSNTPYSIDKPEEFLSKKAIERRKKFDIKITKQDLPISPKYIKKIKELDVKIIKRSKWLNCVIVQTKDTNKIKDIKKLNFVAPKPKPLPKKYEYIKAEKEKVKYKKPNSENIYEYGNAYDQVSMLNVDKLHNLGFDGKNVTMAIFDGGFYNVNELPAFDSLWANNQIIGWYDYVDMDTTVFDDGDHGMMVLSTIGGNMEGFIGTAPKANFWLFVTEDGDSETQLEEYNFVIAAEKADSLGVDIIHASLGYNEFDVAGTSYKYEDLDGNTAISTIGADIAASKGIIVTSSAGNEGRDPWKYISAPADGDSVLAVGAVNFKGRYADFSSLGPTYDGRIKPDVVAQGYAVYVQGRRGLTTASGTSFSGPVFAGAVACLVQAFPEVPNMDIIKAIQINSSQVEEPDDHLGYGIPDFYKIYMYIKKKYK